jgi:hypothetical protein
MRPRIRITLSAEEREVLSTWRKCVLAVYALLAAGITGYLALTPGTGTIAQGVSKDEQARAETCVQQTGSLPDSVDSKTSKQAATRDTTCTPADDPARVGRASTRQPKAN